MAIVSPSTLEEVWRAFAKYRATVEAAPLTRSSKDTYTDRAEKFVRWLAGEFEPGAKGKPPRQA